MDWSTMRSERPPCESFDTWKAQWSTPFFAAMASVSTHAVAVPSAAVSHVDGCIPHSARSREAQSATPTPVAVRAVAIG